jgi:RNA polymerase sigma-70 factor (ECF subfamily)
MDEQSVITHAVAGDLNAFNQLVLTYQNLAYSIAYRVLQDDSASADAVQDSFIKAFRALATFQGGNFKSWLTRIVINTCYDLLRTQKRRATDSLDDLPAEAEYTPYFVDPAEGPEAYAERMELNQLIEQGIRTLSPEQRTVIVLCDIHGYAYEEIADITGLPIGTVKSRISRARTRLRDFLLQKPELLPSTFRPYNE